MFYFSIFLAKLQKTHGKTAFFLYILVTLPAN